MVFDTRVTALTQSMLLPKVVDNVLGGNVLAYRLIGNARKGAGASIKKAVKVTNSGTAVSFAGLDSFTAAPLDTKIVLEYDMRAVRQPIAISGMDATANAASSTQITNLVTNALEETEQELADKVGTLGFGDGTGNGGKDFIGIGAIVDDGTDVSTIGGQSRTTYPVLKATRTVSGGTLTFLKMATLFSAVSKGTLNTSPTLIDSNETVWDLYESLLTPTVRENYSQMGYYTVARTGGVMRPEQGLKGTAGFVALTYKGIPMVRDEKATSGNLFMLNENTIDYYGWDPAGFAGYSKISLGSTTVEGGVYEDAPSDYNGFSWSGFKTSPNQFGEIADVIMLGNFASFRPGANARLTGITTA